MKFFILRSDGAYVAYEGMTQDQITAMLAEQTMTCTFIDEAAYQAAVAVNKP